MSTDQCEWCGEYFIDGKYSYLRDSNNRYRRYDFCSNKCAYKLIDKTGLIIVNHNGLTDEEQQQKEIRDREEEERNRRFWNSPKGKALAAKKAKENKQHKTNSALSSIRNGKKTISWNILILFLLLVVVTGALLYFNIIAKGDTLSMDSISVLINKSYQYAQLYISNSELNSYFNVFYILIPPFLLLLILRLGLSLFASSSEKKASYSIPKLDTTGLYLNIVFLLLLPLVFAFSLWLYEFLAIVFLIFVVGVPVYLGNEYDLTDTTTSAVVVGIGGYVLLRIILGIVTLFTEVPTFLYGGLDFLLYFAILGFVILFSVRYRKEKI